MERIYSDSHNSPIILAEPIIYLLWIRTQIPEGFSDFPPPFPGPTVTGPSLVRLWSVHSRAPSAKAPEHLPLPATSP